MFPSRSRKPPAGTDRVRVPTAVGRTATVSTGGFEVVAVTPRTAPFVASNRIFEVSSRLWPRASSNRTVKSVGGKERSDSCWIEAGPERVTFGPSRSQTQVAGRLSRALVTGVRAAPPRSFMVIVPEAAGVTSTR